MANKNSAYVQSLVDFILDTKPYHSKLTEVVEEYRFFDSMTVHFDERLFSSTMAKSAWLYSHFADGVSSPSPTTKIHRLLSPMFRTSAINNQADCRGAFKINRDENTDLPLVPFAFDPTNIQGTGLADAFVQRNGLGTRNEPLVEAVDVHQSHGAYVFQIKQTISTQPIVLGRFSQEYKAYEDTVMAGSFVIGVTYKIVSQGTTDFTAIGATSNDVGTLFTATGIGTGDGTAAAPITYPFNVTMAFEAPTMVITGPAFQLSSTAITVTGPGMVSVVGLSNDPNYDPQYVERSNENLIASMTSASQAIATNKTDPASAISRIQVVLDMITTQLIIEPNANASAELASVQAIVDANGLPSSYEDLISALYAAGTSVPNGTTFDIGNGNTQVVTNWGEVHSVLDLYSPSIYFNAFTDLGVRESGAVVYDNLYRPDIAVKNIKANQFRPNYEEWTLIAASATTFFVKGSITGVIGSAVLPGTFTSTYISFDLSDSLADGVVQSVVVGTEITLSPSNKILVHMNAPLESWSIIKTNPLAYTRPLFTSTRYGYVKNAVGARDYVTILSDEVPTCTVILTAINSTTFSVTDTSGWVYTDNAIVGQEFNDGRLQFTIIAGADYAFQQYDRFFIEIQNDPAVADDLDLYYGFDLAPFDGNEYVYNTVNSALQDYQSTLDFGWDSRFVNYDWQDFNLQLAQNVVSGREWRVRALPNLSKPLLLQNSSPTNMVNLIGTDDALNPDAASQFDMTDDVTSDGIQSSTDPDVATDLQLWYADSFAVEYYNATYEMWVLVGTLDVGDTFTSATHGISFTLVPAAKPFIAARLTSSWYDTTGPMHTETVEGGDTFYWSVRNDPPYQSTPAGVESIRIPRLVMHADSYHFTAAANWYLTFTSSSQYELQGYYTTGVNSGSSVFSTPRVIDLGDGESYFSRDDQLHWTVKSGSGFGAGDQFTFTTFETKPIFLVHGSVSGWQPDAEYDKYYWNGKIGFKIHQAEVQLFENNVQLPDFMSSLGQVTVEQFRYDSPSTVYHAYAHNDGYWTLYRDGTIVAAGANELVNDHIKITMPTAVAGASLYINVVADEIDFPLGHDLAIIRTTPGRAPLDGDFALFTRTREDGIQISVKPVNSAHSATLAALAPTTIDLRYVDHTAGSGVPLSVTSPETAVLSGWLPTLITKFDSATSSADFSDPATIFEVRSAVLDQKIGTVRPRGSDVDDVVFEWDSSFAAQHLPLNTEATIVTRSSGMDEAVKVNITEGIKFLFGGGGLSEDTWFMDTVNVNIVESDTWKIKSTYNTDFNVEIADGPFGGFLPGFDNLPFDLEDGVDGYFDAGQAFSGVFQRARQLALQNVLTPQEQAEYNDLIALLGPYTSDPATMTFDQFVALLEAEPPVNYTPQYFGFGVPALGLGIEITDRQGDGAGASVEEAMTIRVLDYGFSYDQYGFDAGGMDTPADSSITVLSKDIPPVPSSGVPSGLYGDFETPLTLPAPGGRVIEVSFTNPVLGNPQFYIWRPADSAPVPVAVFERISNHAFRFSLPAPSEAKLIVV